ncbi:hypothetical protein LXA43DRAFT_734097 [Ganoderma leucocontextum]|nr:hypothetical protein LXA43DRAFT_734097 [Ganoderma leucocontextum]
MAAFVLMSRSPLEVRDQIQSAGRFPSVGKEVLSALVHLLGISIISGMLSRKLEWVTHRPSWPRLLVIFNLIDSWTFIFTIAILVHGLGMELSVTVCTMGILSCIIFYGTSKIFIYLFLTEKVYAVWATGPIKGRMHCKVYLACLALVSCYIGVGILMVVERIAVSDNRGTCYIGLRRISSVFLLSYDVSCRLVNVLLTSLFVWPLLRKKLTPALRAIAIRNLWCVSSLRFSSPMHWRLPSDTSRTFSQGGWCRPDHLNRQHTRPYHAGWHPVGMDLPRQLRH